MARSTLLPTTTPKVIEISNNNTRVCMCVLVWTEKLFLFDVKSHPLALVDSRTRHRRAVYITCAYYCCTIHTIHERR